MKYKKWIFALLIFIPLLTYATNLIIPPFCTLSSSGGIFDKFLANYYNVIDNWQNVFQPWVIKIFWFFFSIELLWQISKKMLSGDIAKLYVFFFIRVIIGALFSAIFLNVDFYLGIITFFIHLGAQAANMHVDLSATNPFSVMSPSGVMNLPACMLELTIQKIHDASIVESILYALPTMGAIFFCYIFAGLIALILVARILMAYVMIYGGFILCGFAGSSWTQNYWQKYLSAIMGVAINLFVTCLIIGIAAGTLQNSITDLVNSMINLDFKEFVGYEFAIPCLLLVNLGLIFWIPSVASSMLNGNISSGLGEIIGAASTVMAGGMVAKSLGGAVGTAMSAPSMAKAEGLKAAQGKARQLLQDSIGSGRSSSGDSGSSAFNKQNKPRTFDEIPEKAKQHFFDTKNNKAMPSADERKAESKEQKQARKDDYAKDYWSGNHGLGGLNEEKYGTPYSSPQAKGVGLGKDMADRMEAFQAQKDKPDGIQDYKDFANNAYDPAYAKNGNKTPTEDQWKSEWKSQAVQSGKDAATNSLKNSANKTKEQALDGLQGLGKVAKTVAQHADKSHSGGADLNINPHREHH